MDRHNDMEEILSRYFRLLGELYETGMDILKSSDPVGMMDRDDVLYEIREKNKNANNALSELLEKGYISNEEEFELDTLKNGILTPISLLKREGREYYEGKMIQLNNIFESVKKAAKKYGVYDRVFQ